MTREPGSKKVKAGTVRFDAIRRWIYGGLLIFVIAAGVPMATVPSLRSRLVARVHALKAAIFGETGPVMVQAGENREPFPVEYERPLPPAFAPALQIPDEPIGYGAQRTGESPARKAPRRTLRIPPVAEPLPSAGEGESPVGQSESALPAETENQPKYLQGPIEKEAYDVLLQSNSALAGIVQGSNPSLQFVSWDAAGRGEDIFWVRLKFRQEGKTESEYIWQIQLESKRVTPLNYNARTLQ